jgi:uncharacterized protein (TIGR02569 family)
MVVPLRKSPPPGVLAEFGAVGLPEPIEGGQATSWRIGDLILKPLDVELEELEWQARLFDSIHCDGFRVARPRQTRDGSFSVDRWCAWERVAGRHRERRWPEIIAVGDRFHGALAAAPRPAFLDARTDPWAIGDRVAWGELPPEDFLHVKHLTRLAAALRPIEAHSQLVHGDLTGNVLFADGLPPALIDFSPYWRPIAFASAVVVADALVWEGANGNLLKAVAHIERFDQFLLRALIYRAVTDWLFRQDQPIRPDAADPYLDAVELACRLAGSAGAR